MDKPGSRKGLETEPRTPDTDAELLAQCRIDSFRSGGKGGQHQNKTETGIRLTHRPTGLSAVATRSRSQAQNKTAALAALRAKLEARNRPQEPRIPTKVPLKEKRKRVDEKKKKSRIKSLRSKPTETED